jgi:PhnB protein
MAKAKSPIPEGFQTVTPVLTLDDARSAIDWYKRVLGAEEVSSHPGPDGKIMHAQIRIGSSPIMLHDAMMGFKGPLALGASPAGLWIYVEDSDTLFNRAVEAGGKVGMPFGDQFWGDRCGNFTDPFGYTWTIATRKEDLTDSELQQRQEEFFQQMAGQSRE